MRDKAEVLKTSVATAINEKLQVKRIIKNDSKD